jgi:hypothetical protein
VKSSGDGHGDGGGGFGFFCGGPMLLRGLEGLGTDYILRSKDWDLGEKKGGQNG